MLPYTIDRYIAVLRMRRTRTILVEGSLDKHLLHCVVSELGNQEGALNIDTAENISSPTNGMGNREKVRVCHEIAIQRGQSLKAMIDREFDGFVFYPVARDDIGKHGATDDGLFSTRGHSIENYFLTVDNVLSVMRCLLPFGRLPTDYETRVRAHFDRLVYLSALITLAMLHTRVFSRLDGAAYDCWCLDDSSAIQVDLHALDEILRARGVEGKIDQFHRAFENCSTGLPPEDHALHRWIGHGHTAVRLVWAGISLILDPRAANQHTDDAVTSTESGRQNRQRSQVARGHWEQRMLASCSFAASSWAKGTDDPPHELLSWLAEGR